MDETVIWFIVCLVGLPLYFFINYFATNSHISSIKLSEIEDVGVKEICDDMIKLLMFVTDTTQKPKLKFGDLSKEVNVYDGRRIHGAYYGHLKLIVIDLKHIREENYSIKDLAELLSHEFQHFVDHLNNITYETVGMELCESRARKFEKKGRREIVSSLKFS